MLEVGLGFGGDSAATGSAFDEAKLEEIGLIVILDSGGFIAGEGSDGVEADGAVAVILEHEAEHVAVGRVRRFPSFGGQR